MDDTSLAATMRRHPAGRRRAPEPPEEIAARSVCPTCDGRDAARHEEAYVVCIFCATGTKKPRPAVRETTQAAATVEARRASAETWGEQLPLALD